MNSAQNKKAVAYLLQWVGCSCTIGLSWALSRGKLIGCCPISHTSRTFFLWLCEMVQPSIRLSSPHGIASRSRLFRAASAAARFQCGGKLHITPAACDHLEQRSHECLPPWVWPVSPKPVSFDLESRSSVRAMDFCYTHWLRPPCKTGIPDCIACGHCLGSLLCRRSSHIRRLETTAVTTQWKKNRRRLSASPEEANRVQDSHDYMVWEGSAYRSPTSLSKPEGCVPVTSVSHPNMPGTTPGPLDRSACRQLIDSQFHSHFSWSSMV